MSAADRLCHIRGPGARICNPVLDGGHFASTCISMRCTLVVLHVVAFGSTHGVELECNSNVRKCQGLFVETAEGRTASLRVSPGQRNCTSDASRVSEQGRKRKNQQKQYNRTRETSPRLIRAAWARRKAVGVGEWRSSGRSIQWPHLKASRPRGRRHRLRIRRS